MVRTTTAQKEMLVLERKLAKETCGKGSIQGIVIMNVIVSQVLRENSQPHFKTSKTVRESIHPINTQICRNVSGVFHYRITHESKTDSLLL